MVITRRSWKPFVRKGAWVRIPPSPFIMIESMMSTLGEVPKWLKGLAWKVSRSLIAARGFKSLLLRSLDRHVFWVVETIQKKSKKVVDKTVDTRYTNQADCESETKREQPLRKKRKKIKKLLTNGWWYDIINKLSLRDDNDEWDWKIRSEVAEQLLMTARSAGCTLITEQWINLERS